MKSLPPSLSVIPNIPHHHQTISQLVAERDYWLYKLSLAPGPASASASYEFFSDCNKELRRRGIKEK